LQASSPILSLNEIFNIICFMIIWNMGAFFKTTSPVISKTEYKRLVYTLLI
jgi:hypothetical protein